MTSRGQHVGEFKQFCTLPLFLAASLGVKEEAESLPSTAERNVPPLWKAPFRLRRGPFFLARSFHDEQFRQGGAQRSTAPVNARFVVHTRSNACFNRSFSTRWWNTLVFTLLVASSFASIDDLPEARGWKIRAADSSWMNMEPLVVSWKIERNSLDVRGRKCFATLSRRSTYFQRENVKRNVKRLYRCVQKGVRLRRTFSLELLRLSINSMKQKVCLSYVHVLLAGSGFERPETLLASNDNCVVLIRFSRFFFLQFLSLLLRAGLLTFRWIRFWQPGSLLIFNSARGIMKESCASVQPARDSATLGIKSATFLFSWHFFLDTPCDTEIRWNCDEAVWEFKDRTAGRF